MMKQWLCVLAVVLLAGCDTLSYKLGQAQQALQQSARKSDTAARAAVDTEPKILTATGYAPISLQPGATQDQKVLMAMRASKLRAYQELAAMVHGQYLFGTTQVRDMVVQNDQFSAAVGGIVRGARVVKTYPVQADTYATILELDLRDVERAYVEMQ